MISLKTHRSEVISIIGLQNILHFNHYDKVARKQHLSFSLTKRLKFWLQIILIYIYCDTQRWLFKCIGMDVDGTVCLLLAVVLLLLLSCEPLARNVALKSFFQSSLEILYSTIIKFTFVTQLKNIGKSLAIPNNT